MVSSMASCADTRGGRVESPIRPFFTQQIASYGRAFPTHSCCLPPRCIQISPRDFNEDIFEGWVFGSRRDSVGFWFTH